MGFLRDNGLEETQKVESETTGEPSGEPTTEETVETTEDKNPEESKTQENDSVETPESKEVPASFQKRINELTYKYKSEREAKIKLEEELKKTRQNPAQPTSEEEKREQNAREYLRNLLKEELNATKAEEEAADKKLNDEIEHVAALYPDFKEDEVLNAMEKFGITDVEKAYLASKEMNRVVEKTKEETKKQILAKPKSPSSVKTQDAAGTKFSDEDIKGKSIFELAEMAKKEAGIN